MATFARACACSIVSSVRVGAVLWFALGGVLGCGQDDRPSPRDTVKGLFAAIENSDSTFLTANVDLPQAAGAIREDLFDPLIDTTMDEPEWGERLLGALTGESILRERWLSAQIVLGKHEICGDTALIEVSFIDRLTHVQYYNKMRLLYRSGRWVITDFKVL